MSEIIVVHGVPEGKDTGPLFIAPTDLHDRIQAAAEWCQQTEYEFIKAGILDRLDDVETIMTGWDFEDVSVETGKFDVEVAIVPARREEKHVEEPG